MRAIDLIERPWPSQWRCLLNIVVLGIVAVVLAIGVLASLPIALPSLAGI